MQIEEGKYYRTRDGRKVGPMRHFGECFDCKNDDEEYWQSDGTNGDSTTWNTPELDLIAEWSDTLPLLGDMTDAEIGALVRAWHNGQKIEYWHTHHLEWTSCEEQPIWAKGLAYRIKPETVRETVTLFREPRPAVLPLEPVGTIDLIDGVFQPDTFKPL